MQVIARNSNIIQAFIFVSAQGVLITTMIKLFLLPTILGNLQEIKKNFLLNLTAQKPKLTVDCKKDGSCKKSFPIQLLRGQWWLADHIKVCRRYCLAQSSIFSKDLKFLIESHTISSLFENCHWSVKVPLCCNLMGYLLGIKIRGHEFNLPSDGFLRKITLCELQCLFH